MLTLRSVDLGLSLPFEIFVPAACRIYQREEAVSSHLVEFVLLISFQTAYVTASFNLTMRIFPSTLKCYALNKHFECFHYTPTRRPALQHTCFRVDQSGLLG